ncbi:MAG TPA: hypothetical protein VFQ25_03795 [Ktedonobacterales bacterium]|nr:hypothetical protein [Ktedonobacterales bacterium]
MMTDDSRSQIAPACEKSANLKREARERLIASRRARVSHATSPASEPARRRQPEVPADGRGAAKGKLTHNVGF